jgi:hypothetical protein
MPQTSTVVKDLVAHLFAGFKDEHLLSEAATLLEQAPKSLIAEAVRLMPPGYDPFSAARARDITRHDLDLLTLGRAPEQRVTWHDCIDRRRSEPMLYCKPSSLPELVEIVKSASADGLRIKGVGSGHSFSDVTDAPDCMVDTHSLAHVLEVDPDRLRDPALGTQLFRVQGGMRIKDLNQALAKSALAMPNLGGYTGQTFAGAISTSTHGSGMQLGPLPDYVVSLQLVSTDGKLYQIEPTQGITDPSKFSGSEDAVPVQLVQDDNWFNAAVVSMGCMGIIYSLVLRAQSHYWLQETRSVEPWPDIKQQIAGGNEVNRVRHYEVMLNPHTWKGDRSCLVTRRELLPSPPAHPLPGARNRNPLIQLLSIIQGDGTALLFFMNNFPQLVPWFLNQCVSGLADHNYVAPSYEIFDLGPINDVRAYGIEVAVPLAQATTATERVFEIAEQVRRIGGQYTTAPFALRFVKPSNAFLSPMFGRPTCMVEVICMYGSSGSDELLQRYEQALLALGGRPHWGLSLDSIRSFDQLRALYPESLDPWLAVYRQLNSKGTFNNSFTNRIGISV